MIVQKRGKNVALAGAVLQIAMSAVMLAIWLKTGSVAAMSATAFLACGTLLWLMAGLLFYCRQLKRREELEFQEITAAGATAGAIFEAGRDPELQPAANRLKFMMRWIVPSFTLFWAALAGTIAIVIIYAMASRKVAVMPQATVAAMFAVLTGFAGFLFSRYSVGMSDSPEWRLLRATGSYLTVNVLAIVAVAAALLVDPQGYVDHVVAFVIPVVQCILSVELLLNFILDLYRPRLPGQEDRVSFDSRLFNLVAQPGKIGHSLAEAINYQFGFEVSKTWFYQLLGKSLLPLIIFGILIMLAMSCIVVVENGERYVVTHLGQPQAKLLEPGINFKLPWPIDTARRFEVGKLQDIMLGVGAARTEEERTEAFVNGRELYLWTKEHGPRQEKDFVIASPPRTLSKDGAEVKSDAPPVNLIKLVVRIQYRITNPLEYGYNYVDAHKTLECLASGEMVRYCASATLDEPVGDSADRPEAIMTYGRIRTGEELKSRIQKLASEMRLGVEIVYVGLDAVHPPVEVAPEYEKVLEAERRQESRRFAAEGDAAAMLAEVAGDSSIALKLALAIRIDNELEILLDAQGDPARYDTLLDDDLARIKSDIANLDIEIARDQLLGRMRADTRGTIQLTSPQELRGLYAAYQAQLNQIKEAGAKDRASLKATLASAVTAARASADALLGRSLGQSASIIARARADRWTQELAEMALAEVFQKNLTAYNANPEVFMADRRMEVWEEVLPNMSKFVLAVDRSKVDVWLDWSLQRSLMSEVNIESLKPR